VVSNERAGPVSAFTPSTDTTRPAFPTDAGTGSGDARTASFDIGGYRIELAARDGATTLHVTGTDRRDSYLVDPEALDRWAEGTERLLGLSPASGPDERADFRAPFLMDAEGRAALAFEAVVTEQGVAHRLLVMAHDGRVAALPTSAEDLRELVAAARGAVSFARQR
jgi:hypothetical protein